MTWIESHQALSRHRKTRRAVALLKVDRHKFIGHLHELWWWALDNATDDGLLPGLSEDEIAEGAEWPVKDAARFVDVLCTAGFLDRSDEGFVLHDWYDYAGKLNAKRAANRDRMRGARAGHVQRTDVAQTRAVQGLPTYQPTNQPTSAQNSAQDGVDVDFRDRYGSLVTALGGHLSEANARKFTDIAEEWTLPEIEDALRKCTIEGKRPWPNEVVARLPKRGNDDSGLDNKPAVWSKFPGIDFPFPTDEELAAREVVG